MARISIRTCKKCGFILGTKPGLLEKDGVCQACINTEEKKSINFGERQSWLTEYIAEHRETGKYDCVIGVSGGKDSHMIVERLLSNHGIKKPLLVSIVDEFSITQAGQHNRDNISRYFGLDHIFFRYNPNEFCEHALNGFENNLNPLQWFEEKIYQKPFEIAKNFGINTVFMGENSAFEYGSSELFDIFCPISDNDTKVIYLGSIYPYSTRDSLDIAKSVGFKDLTYFHEWYRQGNIEQYTQIDSIGYLVHIWCKFSKFGFQRVSDIACRNVREGIITREQAMCLIRDHDYILDPAAKNDFCQRLGITLQHFDDIVEKHTNYNLIYRDCNGLLRRSDFE